MTKKGGLLPTKGENLRREKIEMFDFAYWIDGLKYSAKSYMPWEDALAHFEDAKSRGLHSEILDASGSIVKTTNERISGWLRRED